MSTVIRVPNPLLGWIADPHRSHGLRIRRDRAWVEVSYELLSERARRTSTALKACDVMPGDVVALAVSEPEAFASAFFGTLIAGGTPMPMAPPQPLAGESAYTTRLRDILCSAQPRVVLIDESHAEVFRTPCAEIGSRIMSQRSVLDHSPCDSINVGFAQAAILQFTSGSSGTPRAVSVPRDALEGNVAAIRSWLDVNGDDIGCSWLPLHHDMGLGMLLTAVIGQNDFFLMSPEQFIRNPLAWLECLGRHGATITAAPTFGYAHAVRRVRPDKVRELDTSGVRSLIVGAERVDPRTLRSFLELLRASGLRPNAFRPAYGLAEATVAVTGVPMNTEATVFECDGSTMRIGEPVVVSRRCRLGDADDLSGPGCLVSSGPPVDGVTVEVLGENGEELPEGHLGEIAVTGPSVARPLTAATESYTRIDGPRLLTGDIGFVVGGETYVVGRVGDSIKLSGRRVYAEDLEALLVQHAGVPQGRCVVLAGVGRLDAVTALIEDPRPDWVDGTVGALRRYLGHGPEVTVLALKRGQIERTTSGKPRRRVMYDLLASGQLQATLYNGTEA